MKARVMRSSQRDFECRLLTGELVRARALGNLLKNEESIVVGDYVTLKKEQDEYVITTRQERANEIYRLLVRESKKKVTAANCDLMMIISSVSKPAYKRGIIDRFLVRAHQWQIKPLVVFNKMDEFSEGALDLCFEADRLKGLGVECFELSCRDPNYQTRYLKTGLKELRETLTDRTAILLGQSGVGKSSMVNALSPEGRDALKTNEVGKAGKGTHTTTWSEIIDLTLFDLIDSPGIRSFSLDDIDPEELMSYFSDLEELAQECSFTNCQHLETSKGCAFYKLDKEDRNTQLIHSRLESFLKIQEEASAIPIWAKKN